MPKEDAIIVTAPKPLKVPEWQKKEIEGIAERIVDEKIDDIDLPASGTKIYKHEIHRTDGNLVAYFYAFDSTPVPARDSDNPSICANALLALFRNGIGYTDTGRPFLCGYLNSNNFNYYVLSNSGTWTAAQLSDVKEDVVTEM